MKKIIVSLLIFCTISLTAFAQQTVTKKKVRKTSTIGQKVHNTFSKHKRHNGYVVKTKRDENGHMVKTKKKVEYEKH